MSIVYIKFLDCFHCKGIYENTYKGLQESTGKHWIFFIKVNFFIIFNFHLLIFYRRVNLYLQVKVIPSLRNI